MGSGLQSPGVPHDRSELSLSLAIDESTKAFLEVGSVDADIWELTARCIDGLVGAIPVVWAWAEDRSRFEVVDEPATSTSGARDSRSVQGLSGGAPQYGPIHFDARSDAPATSWPDVHDRTVLASRFEALGVSEGWFVPVVVDDRTFGMLLVARSDGETHLSKGDLARARHVAGCTALALDRARLTRQVVQLEDATEKRRAFGAREVLDRLQDAVVTTDLRGIVTGWNEAATLLYGIPEDEAVGHRVFDLVSTVPTGRWTERSIGDHLRRDRSWSGELDQIAADGRRLHVTATSTVIGGPDRDHPSIVTTIRDENEWRMQIKRSEAMNKSMLDALPARTVLVDADGVIIAANRSWRYAAVARGGADDACAVGANYLDVCARSAESGDEVAAQTLAGLSSVLRGDVAVFALDYECNSDVVEWFSLKAHAVQGGGAVVGHYDITIDRARAAELAWVAAFDTVTELPNHHSLTRRLEHELAVCEPGTGGRTGVLLADISRFRVVNDSLGHGAGDDVLRQVAVRLIETVGPDDYVARFAGGMFAVVACRDRPEDFADLAAEVGSVIARQLHIRGRQLELMTTIGVAIASPESHAESLLSVADSAVHTEKRRGIGRVSIIDVADSEPVGGLDEELELRTAISAGQLELEYQAIVDTRYCVPHGFEALVRWNHPERGRIPPNSFIPLAEESGLIVRLGEWVLGAAVATASTWSETLSVSVNLSPLQTADPGLVHMVEKILERHQFDPRRLILEVTERSLVSDDPMMTEPFTRLRRLGVRISIDDFGTGYSSLAYLRLLPVDILKIDKSFIDEIPGSGEPIVAAIIDLATALNLDVIAEGIEHEEQFVLLGQLGCGEVQGFHLHRPARAADLDEMLAAHSAAVTRS